MRILIIEDDQSMAKLIQDILKTFGGWKLTTVIAGNLSAALREIGSVDGVLCDGLFPAGPGFEPGAYWWCVWSEVKEKHIPFVLVSGDEDCLAAAKAFGVPALRKPFNVQELFALVSREVERGKAKLLRPEQPA